MNEATAIQNRIRGGVRIRVVVIGLILMALNAYWVAINDIIVGPLAQLYVVVQQRGLHPVCAHSTEFASEKTRAAVYAQQIRPVRYLRYGCHRDNGIWPSEHEPCDWNSRAPILVCHAGKMTGAICSGSIFPTGSPPETHMPSAASFTARPRSLTENTSNRGWHRCSIGQLSCLSYTSY